MLWLQIWVIASTIILLLWRAPNHREYPVIAVFIVSVFCGNQVMRALMHRPPKSDTMVMTLGMIGLVGSFAGCGLIIFLGSDLNNRLLTGIGVVFGGFLVGWCHRWTTFLLPTKPFQGWGDADPFEDLMSINVKGWSIQSYGQDKISGRVNWLRYTEKNQVTIEYQPDGSIPPVWLLIPTKGANYVQQVSKDLVHLFVAEIGDLVMKPETDSPMGQS